MYYVARNLKGFRTEHGTVITSLRVRLIKDLGVDAVVCTADLLDAGTTLCLAWAQLDYLEG